MAEDNIIDAKHRFTGKSSRGGAEPTVSFVDRVTALPRRVKAIDPMNREGVMLSSGFAAVMALSSIYTVYNAIQRVPDPESDNPDGTKLTVNGGSVFLGALIGAMAGLSLRSACHGLRVAESFAESSHIR